MEINLVKKENGIFVLAYDSDFEKAKKIPFNEVFEVIYKAKRNLKFHKKFFALINMVYDNQERYDNIEMLREHLTIHSGFYDLSYTLDGEEYKKAKSISFAKMDENEFKDFYKSVIDTIVKYFNFDTQLIMDNIEKYF